MIREVIFDIETQKLFDQIPDRENLSLLGVSVVSAYRRELDENLKETRGEMKSFWEKDLAELGGWFEEADRIIGFNSLKFDVPVLVPHFERDLFRLPHFDILDKVKEVLGFRVSLDALAKETLGESKMANGLMAVDWWIAGDPESLKKLQQYCEMDVEVTKKLYDVGLKGEKLKFRDKWNEIREFGVDFSHPKKEEETQLGLF